MRDKESKRMPECSFRDHQWDPKGESSPEFDKATMTCLSCGVGHEVTFDKRVLGAVTTSLRIFPSIGSATISRDVVRWSILTHEANLADIRRAGVEVFDEPVALEGTPVGI